MTISAMMNDLEFGYLGDNLLYYVAKTDHLPIVKRVKTGTGALLDSVLNLRSKISRQLPQPKL